VEYLDLIKPLASIGSYIHYKLDRIRLARLIKKGLTIGRNVYIMEDVEFDLNYPYLIEIGDNCRISKGVRILAHDATTFRDLGITKLAKVKILEGSFIGERTIILPGVTVGPRSLIAAGSLVNRDIPENKVAAGNPARPYGSFSDLIEKNSEIMKTKKVFIKNDIQEGRVTPKDLIAHFTSNDLAYIAGVPKKDPYYVNTDMRLIRLNAIEAYKKALNKADSD
jgi:maltose O-acetyltransferase